MQVIITRIIREKQINDDNEVNCRESGGGTWHGSPVCSHSTCPAREPKAASLNAHEICTNYYQTLKQACPGNKSKHKFTICSPFQPKLATD